MDTTLLINNSLHCWMLHVASVCTPCCMLLQIVGSYCAKFETCQTFSFVQNECNNSQCWPTMLCPFAQGIMVKAFFKNKNFTNCSSTYLKRFQILAIGFWWEAHSLCDEKNKTKTKLIMNNGK